MLAVIALVLPATAFMSLMIIVASLVAPRQFQSAHQTLRSCFAASDTQRWPKAILWAALISYEWCAAAKIQGTMTMSANRGLTFNFRWAAVFV